MKSMKAFVAAAAFAVTLAAPAAAQLPGYPMQPVSTGTGIYLTADYGNPDNIGTAWGIGGGVGFGRFGAMAHFGNVGLPLGGNTDTYGGSIAMRLLGGGLNPIKVSVQLSGAYQSGNSSNKLALPGVAVRVSPPLFPIKPWGVAYYIASDDLSGEARMSIGADFNLLFGLGIHAGYDFGTKSGSYNTWGVGAHFKFALPGVPVVPGV